MGLLKSILELIFLTKDDNKEENEYTEEFIYHHLYSENDADDYATHTSDDDGES